MQLVVIMVRPSPRVSRYPIFSVVVVSNQWRLFGFGQTEEEGERAVRIPPSLPPAPLLAHLANTASFLPFPPLLLTLLSIPFPLRASPRGRPISMPAAVGLNSSA